MQLKKFDMDPEYDTTYPGSVPVPQSWADERRRSGLRECVECSMQRYFADLDGSDTSDLLRLFLEEVERPFYKAVMEASKGNLTLAAKWLGIHRMTLKSRLKKYRL